MSANWDGCSFKEEGPWAEEEKEKSHPFYSL